MEVITLLQAEHKDGRRAAVLSCSGDSRRRGRRPEPPVFVFSHWTSDELELLWTQLRALKSLELQTTPAEALLRRLRFEKRCVQGRWEVSQAGGVVAPLPVNLRAPLHVSHKTGNT